MCIGTSDQNVLVDWCLPFVHIDLFNLKKVTLVLIIIFIGQDDSANQSMSIFGLRVRPDLYLPQSADCW